MSIKPCPFCGSKAGGPQPIFDSVGYVMEHQMGCFLYNYQAITHINFYEDNPQKIEDWNKMTVESPK